MLETRLCLILTDQAPALSVSDSIELLLGLTATLCANIAETFTPQLISVEGGEVFDYVSTYA